MSKSVFVTHITKKCITKQTNKKKPLKIKKMTNNLVEKWARDFNTNFTERRYN